MGDLSKNLVHTWALAENSISKRTETMPPINTHIQQLNVLPLTKYYMDQLNLYKLFDKYVPNSGADVKPAQVLCMMVLNIVNARKPLYRITVVPYRGVAGELSRRGDGRSH